MTDPNPKEWSPPFVAKDLDDVACPACGEETVRVYDKQVYYDGEEIEAYCSECHATLEVIASVDVAFSCPEVVDG